MDDELKQTKAMADNAVAVAAYRGSDCLNHVDAMLTSLSEVYKSRLADVSVDELVRVQALLKQTLAIRGVIRGDQQLPIV